MRLALLAPIGRSIPPRYDGPRERQIALLCAGLVRQGVDVTLFASGDSMAAEQLAAVCPVACTADPPRDAQHGRTCTSRISAPGLVSSTSSLTTPRSEDREFLSPLA
jgi:hypothetical protein